MRKGWMKKALAMGLAAAMTISLAACGGSDNGGTNGGSNGGTNGGNSNAASSGASKEYVFSLTSLDLGESDDVSINNIMQCGDQVYVLYTTYDYTSNASYTNPMLLTMNADGSGQSTVTIPLYKAGEEPAENESSSAELQEDGATEVSNDDYSYSYTSFANATASSDGNIYGVRTYYDEHQEGEEYISTYTNTVMGWDKEGNILLEADISDLVNSDTSEYYGMTKLMALDDGSLLALLSGESYGTVSISADGTVGTPKKVSDAGNAILTNLSCSYDAGNGVMEMIYYSDDSYTKQSIVEYDCKTDTVGEAVELSDEIGGYGLYSISMYGGKVLYDNTQGIYSYDPATQEVCQVLSFINSDLNTTSLYNFLQLDDTHIVAFYWDNTDGKVNGGLLTYVDPSTIPDKAVITIAANYLDYNVRKRVVEFNKESSEYRILVKEYDSYNTNDDYTAGMTKLNNDIISGDMPDILVTSSSMPIESYISKGLIANVDELIAADEELSKNEYLENIFDAYRVDGKLYYVIPDFSVYTMVGKTSIFGERTSITMDELNSIAAQYPDASIFGGDSYTRDTFLTSMMNFCGRDFVDVSTGKCDFTSENFISLLTYAATLPEEINYDDYSDDYWTSYNSRYREDKALLSATYISSLPDMNYTVNGAFGVDVSYVGFPTDGDMGSVISANQSYVISAKSSNIEGAWTFLRYYLTEEYQDSLTKNSSTIPVLKSALQTVAENALKNPTYEDENGNQVEYKNTYWINDESIEIEPLNQAQVDKILEVIENVDQAMYYNESVNNIITEEAAAYFAGQKSVTDVASVIQSRVQIYVNENM